MRVVNDIQMALDQKNAAMLVLLDLSAAFASQSVPLKYGVPQGSVLGPVLFTQYTVAIGAICRRHGVSYLLYADDTQIYITFKIDDPEHQHAARLKIEACIAEIRAWMIIYRLKLNDDKTEYIFLVSANNWQDQCSTDQDWRSYHYSYTFGTQHWRYG